MVTTGLRLHERYFPVRKAVLELSEFYWNWMEKHNLTLVESARALTELLQDTLKYALRNERHPDDPERKADEAD